MASKAKELKRKIRLPFEWLGIGLALSLFVWMPRRMLFFFCDMASRTMYRFDRRGKCFALRNLRIIRSGKDIEVKKYNPTRIEEKIIRRSYRNMARSVGYAFWTFLNAKARCRACGEMSEKGKAFLGANKPVVTVSGHIGCWEILSGLAFLEGHQMMSVAKNIGTSGMTKLLMLARRSIGQEIVSAEGAFKPLMAGIKSGKSLGLLVDQRVSPKKGGIWVRFLGLPLPVSAAPAFFAAKGKTPTVVAWSRPLKDGRYRCEIVTTFKADEARDIWGFTQKCTSALEGVIRRHPSAWVLNYNYFKRPPSDEELKQLEERESK